MRCGWGGYEICGAGGGELVGGFHGRVVVAASKGKQRKYLCMREKDPLKLVGLHSDTAGNYQGIQGQFTYVGCT
jgi:hypothetical protein